MAMDFFEHQEEARRNTFKLLIYFILAVIFIVFAVYAAFLLAWLGILTSTASEKAGVQQAALPPLFDLKLFALVASATICLIAIGSLYKISALSSGGQTVAEMLGGRLINSSTYDPDERKLLNVVEEMSIASGMSVPPVFLMESEDGINAFAAGFSPSDAVIGVTRGCVRLLSRDELQGVIAHEFSHILNGDMRLNLRLIGVLHGILLIGMIGYGILRTLFYSRHGGYSSRRSSRKDGRVVAAAAVMGALLVAIGFVGVFFGRLIKAAVSRQREFLADAASVQFTRNPLGIAGALKKIGGLSGHGEVHAKQAEEISHMFFENALGSKLSSVMATHPPLDERIQRIEPGWNGKFSKIKSLPEFEAPQALQQGKVVSRFAGGFGEVSAAHEGGRSVAVQTSSMPNRGSTFAINPEIFAARVGAPRAEHLAYAEELRKSFPRPLVEAAHELFGARAVIYGLLLDPEKDVRKNQLKSLEQNADPAVYEEVKKLMPDFDSLEPHQRMPLADMALPTLQGLSESQFQSFQTNMEQLIVADKNVDLFEFALHRIILHHLEPKFKKVPRSRVRYYSLVGVRKPCEILLSTLAHFGETDPDRATKAFAAGAGRLRMPIDQLNFLPREKCGLKEMAAALDDLLEVGPIQKKYLVQGCAACIASDDKVTVQEAELLRVVSDSLDCPMPPLLPGESLA